MDGSHPLSFLLKKGFQHCFVCIEDNGLWIQVDGGIGIPIIKYLTTSDFDVAGYWRSQGLTVIETTRRNQSILWPFKIHNCVGLVKWILCINSWSLTPYGLYKYLRKT
jgi:hypothetical protein